jgi:hypothetical protein
MLLPMRRFLLVALVSVIVAACVRDTLEPLPLEATLQANRTTATVVDTIFFTVAARGGSLIGIEIDFADGSNDLFATSGARTASVTFRHAYRVTGTYDVRATVTDALVGERTATLQIRVQ